MRIVQVVTLISPDAAYGGPVRVALNQARELIRRGHEVTLLAGARGYSVFPTEIDGVPVRLFTIARAVPRTGFAGLTSWRLWLHLLKNIKSFDLIHVHLARDLITLPAAGIALLKKIPLAIQCHGMIDPSSRLLAAPMDALFTRRILKAAGVAFYLTPQEKAGLRAVARGPIELIALHNGVPLPGPKTVTKGPVLEVLYLARLQQRKRPQYFVEAALTVLQEGVPATFALVGPDEGAAPALSPGILASSGQIRWEGSLTSSETIARMRQASVYVLPSIDEPFPMSVLEAMSVGLPVIITQSCGLAPAVLEADAGIVVDASQRELTDAIRLLITDPARREAMALNAQRLARDHFSMAVVGDSLESHYSHISGEGSRRESTSAGAGQT